MQRDADAAHERIAQLVRQLHEAPPPRACAGGSLRDVHLNVYLYIRFHMYMCPHIHIYVHKYICPQRARTRKQIRAHMSGLRCAGGGADGRTVGGAVGGGGHRSEGRRIVNQTHQRTHRLDAGADAPRVGSLAPTGVNAHTDAGRRGAHTRSHSHTSTQAATRSNTHMHWR